jgi:GNAT superfamily N-acetyltransferase
VPIKVQPAKLADVAGIVELRNAVNEHLAPQFAGVIHASVVSEKGIRFAMSRATVLVARYRGAPIATLALSTRKPWSIDAAYFTPTAAPLYLTDMAVHPRRQRAGIGRQCIAQAVAWARRWPATAIRLDAYDAQYGAGEFYRKCGFLEVGRSSYRSTPLIYFEMVLCLGGTEISAAQDARG